MLQERDQRRQHYGRYAERATAARERVFRYRARKGGIGIICISRLSRSLRHYEIEISNPCLIGKRSGNTREYILAGTGIDRTLYSKGAACNATEHSSISGSGNWPHREHGRLDIHDFRDRPFTRICYRRKADRRIAIGAQPRQFRTRRIGTRDDMAKMAGHHERLSCRKHDGRSGAVRKNL
jgi:hypothetical protein